MFSRPTIHHLCVLGRNVGDNALNCAIRKMFQPDYRFQHVELLRNKFTWWQRLKLSRARMIFWGGGGLAHSFNPHGHPYRRTGTLWQMELEHVAKISAPIVAFGLGFNHFYGDPDPLPEMGELFQILASRSSLIGFRNDGSRERFLQYFPDLADAVEEIPDPGMFYRVPAVRPDSLEKYAVLQIAADRRHLRYGEKWDSFLDLLRNLCRVSPVPLILVPHTPDDEQLYQELKTQLPITVMPFFREPEKTAEVIGWYAGAEFSISTRGHSQICSIGNQVPTFSLSTHPKVAGFAENLGLSQWCVSPLEESTSDIVDRFQTFLDSHEEIKARLSVINRQCDQTIEKFNARIRRLLPAH